MIIVDFCSKTRYSRLVNAVRATGGAELTLLPYTIDPLSPHLNLLSRSCFFPTRFPFLFYSHYVILYRHALSFFLARCYIYAAIYIYVYMDFSYIMDRSRLLLLYCCRCRSIYIYNVEFFREEELNFFMDYFSFLYFRRGLIFQRKVYKVMCLRNFNSYFIDPFRCSIACM